MSIQEAVGARRARAHGGTWPAAATAAPCTDHPVASTAGTMLLKIVLVAAMVIALGLETDQQCNITRADDIKHRELLKATRCYNPQPSLVQLPVPEGFDYVTPSVVKLPQCTGLSCSAFPERCLPMPGQTVNHTYKVFASISNGVQSECATVTVQEHLACKCSCDEQPCPKNMVFSKETCQCECNPNLGKICNDRRNVYGESVMWSSKLCSCVCDKTEQCDFWDKNQCKCVPNF